MIVLEAGGVVRTYIGGDGGRITVLNGVDLQVAQGEMVAIIGASGAGKSTLLHILGALDQPTAGWVAVAGQRVASGANAALAGEVRRPTDEAVRAETDRDVSSLRNRSIGFVFQFHHLLREFNALENVMMPLWIAGRNAAAAESRARELLDLVGLGGRALHRPGELSGGEQQRVALARALATSPAILLLDEPSGNLDHANSERLHDLLAGLSSDLDVAMVVVTHNRSLAERADRVLLMEGGTLHPSTVQDAVP